MKNDLVMLLLKAYPMLMNRLMQNYQPPENALKLNRSQWKTLFILFNTQKPSMSEMSRIMNLEKGSLTSVIDSLIEKGLVVRVQDPNDRRKILLELTGQSEKVVKLGMKAIGKHIKSKLKNIDDNSISQLHDALKTIFAIAERL